MQIPLKVYEYQKHIAELILIHKQNVILQAPTGAGKTHAALLPFLNSFEKKRDFPQKCIYSVPMRVLANQFVETYQDAVKQAGRSDRIKVNIQTGEQPEDRELRSNLIFATIDQTLSSFLLAPYSLPRRKANLNAAAVMASYLVFDEFHLYEPDSTLPTTLHMLKMLKGITPFMLMTATFSADMLEELADLLDAVVVPGTPKEQEQLRRLESQQKTRLYHVADHPLSARSVLDQHKDRSLVICNTVDRARRLYEAIRVANNPGTEVLLLHSRFLKTDRNETEDQIRDLFRRGNTEGDYIVVSTQAIEVGVDITSTRLHTELAPANSILQRAGRCARYHGDEGDVYIYQHSTDEDTGESIDLLENVNPYTSQKEEFAATLEQFRARSDTKLDFADEQQIITAVHGPRDRQIIEQLRMKAFDHRREMFAVIRQDENADARHLIRDVLQQQVTIHADPDQLLESPFDAPSFGLHPGTLQKYVKLWLERFQGDDSIPWAVKWLKQDPDPDQTNRSNYQWICVQAHEREIRGAPLVVVHPALATYDETLGFLADRGGTRQFNLPEKEERSESSYRYHLETYEDHIRQVYNAAFERGGLWEEMEDAARRLEQHYGWERGSVRRATELAVLLHDVGKLSVKWQGWVRDYQAKIAEPIEKGQAYAHTELQTEEHREIEKSMGRRRPWHAVEGAIAASPTLANSFGSDHPLFRAAFSAIARHHAPQSDSNQEFQLTRDATYHVQATLKGQIAALDLVGVGETLPADFGAADVITQLEQLESLFAYLLIVRVLRSADQLGTSRGIIGSE